MSVQCNPFAYKQCDKLAYTKQLKPLCTA